MIDQNDFTVGVLPVVLPELHDGHGALLAIGDTGNAPTPSKFALGNVIFNIGDTGDTPPPPPK